MTDTHSAKSPVNAVCAILSFVFLACCISAVFDADDQKEKLVATVDSAMGRTAAADLSQFTFEEQPFNAGLSPATVYRGKDATILMLTKASLPGALSSRVRRFGLARTKGGSYFAFNYLSDLHAHDEIPLPFFPSRPCLEASCRSIENGMPLTVDQAKPLFFYSTSFTPERFKAFFHEEAPARRRDA